MGMIKTWLEGNINSLNITRMDANPVAECNLRCKHCLWPHEIRFSKKEIFWKTHADYIARLGIPVNYAGRTLNERGERFIEECLNRNISVGIIDNGYTILRREDFLPKYTHINISLDGSSEVHDYQRGKIGSFDVAWRTILRLKELGYDPIVSTAFSPLSFKDWCNFEARLREFDIPMSVTLVVSYPETVRRNLVNFVDDKLVIRGFNTLLRGIPKLINLYDLRFVRILKNTLKKFSWRPSDVGDSLTAETSNGSKLIYYPDSIMSASSLVLHWDGEFYFVFKKKLIKVKEFSPVYGRQINVLNNQELRLWNYILK